jgi:hypothetical protein
MTGRRLGSGHGLAAALLAGAIAVTGLVFVLVMRQAALPAEASGTVLALFPPGIGAEARFAAIARADGRLVRGTALPNAVIVDGETPGFAGRLEAEGAWRVLAAGPFDLFAAGGCSFGLDPREATRRVGEGVLRY